MALIFLFTAIFVYSKNCKKLSLKRLFGEVLRPQKLLNECHSSICCGHDTILLSVKISAHFGVIFMSWGVATTQKLLKFTKFMSYEVPYRFKTFTSR